jgi:HprK-related kinase B
MREILSRYLALAYPWNLQLRLHHQVAEIRTDDPALIEILSEYFAEFLTDPTTPDFVVHCVDGPAPDPGIELTPRDPEPGKTRIKEEYADAEGLRFVRKRLTGMIFIFDEENHLAVGPCVKNANQIINFVNNRFIQLMLHQRSLLFHAAGVCSGDKGLALSGFAGMGKSTLALQMMRMGLGFVSNDRLMIRREKTAHMMYGIAKYPRINPGTVLNNLDLVDVIPRERRETLAEMPADELRHLEEKYDVVLPHIYGSRKVRIAAPLQGLVVLNWTWNPEPTNIVRVDLRERGDLLPAFMKSPGLFYRSGGEEIPFTGESYLTLLEGVPVYEITGGVSFVKTAWRLIDLLKGDYRP